MHATGLEPVLSLRKQIMSLSLSTTQPYMLINWFEGELNSKLRSYYVQTASESTLRNTVPVTWTLLTRTPP